ncbi:MAG TPA: hypothetical protein VMC02_12985, partial [Steroidobacteraceae bacterium]|nr:hypothetical protein [Steroidobacteraceae bacterium]
YFVRGRIALANEATSGYGIAKVYPLSSDAPPLNPEIVAAPGGAAGAVAEAIRRLKGINGDLKQREQPLEC